MTKVLGCKVPDDLYKKFAGLPGSISYNLRIAIENHIDNIVNIELTHDCKVFSHSQVVERVDCLIKTDKRFKNNSSKEEVF